MDNKLNPAAFDGDRAAKKDKGFMIFGLKSWIKALELAEGQKKSAGKYRYVVDGDATSGKIVLASDGSVVVGTERTRTEWSQIGKPARLASIALRATKDELEPTAPARVEYHFNVISSEAYLTVAGERLNSLGDVVYPSTISDWARLGRPIEQALFQQLNAARDYGNKNAEEITRAKMIKYGVIRKPRADESAAA